MTSASGSTASEREARIAANLAAVRARLETAARRAGRDPGAIRLVAVSKTFGPDDIRAAVAAGQRDFGENKVQEALEKIDKTRDLDLRWHLIGHLQSNKAKKGARFAYIHVLDRVELLERLERAITEQDTAPELLVQVDLAHEPTKHGARVEALDAIFEAVARCSAVRIIGLMLLPPWLEDPEAVRPWFRRLAQLRDTLLARGVPSAMLRELSMGMSHDFEVAIEEGATMVRVGSAIFGKRPLG
ncbi:MAG: YggS family pyridoxal phosphate-dependent enzyme [Luteitalea sp.]|nr:YggS family pyridoxal phosphate-dependent enzyme [Luteitalea sp.]